jgi:hypothetical protein
MRCALWAAMPPTRDTMPMTKNVANIHHTRVDDGDLGEVPGNGPP